MSRTGIIQLFTPILNLFTRGAWECNGGLKLSALGIYALSTFMDLSLFSLVNLSVSNETLETMVYCILVFKTKTK